MKPYHVISAALLLCPLFVVAQQNENPQRQDSLSSASQVRSGRLITFRQMDQRKIYNWRNGQRSTPAGRQADSRGAKYVRVWGDSAAVVFNPDPQKKQ